MMEKTTGIKVYEETALRFMFGCVVAKGFKEAWDFDIQRKMVQGARGELYYTLPLNGHRMRDLSEALTGKRYNTDILGKLNEPILVTTKTMQDLPGFDQYYTDYLADIAKESSEVCVTPIVIEPGYGVHVIVTPA